MKVSFTGRETTKLDGELKQLAAVRPGARYRLTFFAKTDGLVTTIGPRISVVGAKSNGMIVASEPLAAGSSDWRQFTIEFVAPADTRAVLVKVSRTPEFSYDDPTRGVVWFDDFVLVEQSSGK